MRLTRQERSGCATTAFAFVLLSLICGELPAQEPTAAVNQQYREAADLQRGNQFELAVAAWNDFLARNPDHPDVPVATLNLGICYLKSKQYDKALASLNRVIQKHPDHPFRDAALLYLGATQFSLGRAGQREQYAEAVKTLDTLLREFPKGRYLPQALYYRAECDYSLGDKQNAAKLYNRLVSEFPDNSLLPDALYALGVAQEELGQFQAAGATYDRFLKASPNHPLAIEVSMRRGETLFGIGQYQQAASWFAKAAARDDFRLADHALMRQAACLAQLRQYAKAADLYASLAKRFLNSSRIEEANLAAGKCYYLAENWDASRSVLSQIIAARGPSLPEATHWSARSLLKQGKPDEAIALLEKTLSEAGGSPLEAQLRLDLADATYETPKLRGISITLYADVAKKFPDNPVADSALYMAAFTALQLGDHASALSHAEQFFENHGSSSLLPDVVAIAAEAALQLNRLDEAQRRYEDLVGRYPNHPDVPTWQLRRGSILYMQKRYERVLDAIRPIVGRLRSPTAQAEAYYLLGGSLVEMQQFDAAIASIESSLRADPGGRQADGAMLVLADALRRKGDHAHARTIIGRLIATFPKSALLDQANYWLAELAYNDGDMPTAVEGYEAMLREWPKSRFVPDALIGLGWARLSEKQYADAQKAFDRLIAEFPEDDLVAQARFGRGTARQQLNQFEPAIEDIEAFLATKPSGKEKSDALYVLGLCRIGLGREEEAVAAFEALLAEDPKYPGADKTLYELAWALKSLDKPREAAQRFSELARMHPNSVLAAESLFH
ncbi:MAG: tetratricopeptide repeat protein, partial [Pirellulaceae bacterium]|nr:tetratricopeptide repeat protein [Pirellulaceae bacterium]